MSTVVISLRCLAISMLRCIIVSHLNYSPFFLSPNSYNAFSIMSMDATNISKIISMYIVSSFVFLALFGSDLYPFLTIVYFLHVILFVPGARGR